MPDIANIVNMDISTISRVTVIVNMYKHFSVLFYLKDLFSEAYRKDNGELISTKVIKQRLKEIIELEDKIKPVYR